MDVGTTELVTPDSLAIPVDRKYNFWYGRGDRTSAVVFVHGIFSDSRDCWLFEDKKA